jgi:hypothetical protein
LVLWWEWRIIWFLLGWGQFCGHDFENIAPSGPDLCNLIIMMMMIVSHLGAPFLWFRTYHCPIFLLLKATKCAVHSVWWMQHGWEQAGCQRAMTNCEMVTHCLSYWKWSLMVDLPIKNGDCP